MATYPGLQEYFGEGGCYRIGYTGDQPTIDVYLRSVPAFELSGSGQLILPEPSKRSYPDIQFMIDEDTSNWLIVSLLAFDKIIIIVKIIILYVFKRCLF